MDQKNVKFFISLVRDHPELWQKFRKTQCSEEYISKAWDHIGSCLNPPISGIAAATNFKTLEKLFNKCNQFAKVTDRSGANPGSMYTPQWQHYNDLVFLKDQIPPRSTVSSMSRAGIVNLLGAVGDAVNIENKENGGRIEGIDEIIGGKFKDTKPKMTHSPDSGKDQMIRKPLGESNLNGGRSSQHSMPNSLSSLKYSVDLTQNNSSADDTDDEEFERRYPPFLKTLDDNTGQSLSSQSKLENSQLEKQEIRHVVQWCRKRVAEIASRGKTSTHSPTESSFIPSKKSKLHDGSGGSSVDTLGTMGHETVFPHSSNAGSVETPAISVILSMLSTLISILSQVPEESLVEFMIQMLDLAKGLPPKKE